MQRVMDGEDGTLLLEAPLFCIWFGSFLFAQNCVYHIHP